MRTHALWLLPLALGAGVAAAQTPATGGAASDPGAQVLEDWDRELRSVSEALWSSYSATAAMGPDGRGRTIAEDLAAWVMTQEVRAQLTAARAAAVQAGKTGDPARVTEALKDAQVALDEQRRRITLVTVYWERRPSLLRQRELLDRWGRQAPELLPESDARVRPLETQLTHDFAPAMTLDSLSRQIQGLLAAYDQERGRIAGMVSARQSAAGTPVASRDRSLPCPPPAAAAGTDRAQPRTAGGVNLENFYPQTARSDGISGSVILRVTVSAQGCMLHSTLERSSGSAAIDDAAFDVAEQMGYLPAVKLGQAVAGSTPVRFEFTMNNERRQQPPDTATDVSPEAIEALLRKGDTQTAIARLDAALARKSEDVQLLTSRAMAHGQAQHAAAAQADIEHALRLDPGDRRTMRTQGLLALWALEYSKAAAIFASGLLGFPGDESMKRLHVQAEMGARDYPHALEDSAEITAAHPGDVSMRTTRASLLQALHRPDESAAEAAALLQAGTQDLRTYQAAARIYVGAGRFKEALATMDQAVQRFPGVASHLSRASLRAQTDLVARQADIDAALALDPQSLDGLLARAQLNIDAGDPALAVAALNQGAATHADNGRMLLLRSIAQLKAGQPASAQVDLAAARAQAVTPSQLNTFCWGLATADVELEQARQACEAAVAQAPQTGSFLDSLGFVLLRLGRYTEAVQAYDRSLAAWPLNPDSLFGRGLAKQHLGDPVGAALDLDAARASDARIADTFARYGLTPQP